MDRPYRVLDLSDERGQLAGQILAAVGADVVLVEPPGGTSSRTIAPFAADVAGEDRSLVFWGWNRSKRSVVLDLAGDAGQAAVVELARHADVVIESRAVPVDLDALVAVNPALVTVSITAFGSTGPKADWPATDLTVLAAGGQLVLTGDADRPPVRTTVPQAFLHAAGDAACGALTALYERAASGRGQHVDISAQRSVLFATQSHVLAAPYRAGLFHRMAGGHSTAGIDVQMLWPCRDGHVMVLLLFGQSFGPFTARLMSWLHDLGDVDEDLAHEDWIGYGARLFSGREPRERYERVKAAVGAMCMRSTKSELLASALEHRLLIGPTSTTAEIIADPQYADRGFWDHIEVPGITARPTRVPGLPAPCAGATDATDATSRPPRLDEHGGEVLPNWIALAGHDRRPSSVANDRRQPFDGLRVVDLTWALSGPATARYFADFGATVVHVESSHRMDSARTVQPFLDDDSGSENAAVYHNMNVGKLSVSLNLGVPEGREVLDDLIGTADVFIESLSPRARAGLGLDYDRLSADHPDLIMMSSCLFGQHGPLAAYAGFGNMAAAVVGFHELTGWPDRAPAGPFSAYTDYVSPRFAIPLLIQALDERRATGRGRYLDFAQAEAALHFLTPVLIEADLDGHVATRQGNDDPVMVPHGTYPSAGDDQWVTVACRDDRDWRALAEVVGRPDLADLDSTARRRRHDELDTIICAWTRGTSAAGAAHVLVGVGIPSHHVQHSPECFTDEQLACDAHFMSVDHPRHGQVIVEGSRVRLSDTPSVFQRGAPILGQHTLEVVTELLGYDEERLANLLAAGALD